jgi:hypothetical protein
MQLQKVQTKIHELRNQKVMLDFDLAELYEVETRVLNQAVKRNIERFPEDFMFQLSKEEWETLMSQIVISKTEKRGGTQKLPYAFTEQGLAMLSGVLKSKKAIDVNIVIMRTFVFLRQHALTHKDLTEKLNEMEKEYNKQFKDVYEAINYLVAKDKQVEKQTSRKQIGYKAK